MSLVHESLIAALNRKFVSCHFNARAGKPGPRGGVQPGGDAAATAFLQKHRINPRYGCIVNAKGELQVAFGYDLVGVMRAFQSAIVADAEDQKVIDGADRLAASKRASELLRFDQAHGLAAKAVAAASTDVAKARALYWQGHLKLLDALRPDSKGARAIFDSIQDIPADLADDLAVDRVALSVELKPTGSFYTGWQLNKTANAAAIDKALHDAIAKWPQSNRIGEMHFYRGLALRAQKKAADANAVFQHHFTTWPNDRFALLSRIHHTSYGFNPYTSRVMGGAVPADLAERLKKNGGRIDDPELIRKLMEAMRKQGKLPPPAADGGNDDETDDDETDDDDTDSDDTDSDAG